MYPIIKSKDAVDVMNEISGRWLSFTASREAVVCLEKHGLPEHLLQLPCIENTMTLQALLMDMEDVGEVL